MTTKNYLLLLIILTSSKAFAQTGGLSESTKTEIKNFEQKHFQGLTHNYKKLIGNQSDIDILYIYSFDLHDNLKKKELFKDKTFLSYLKVIRGNKKSFLRGQSFAISSSNKRIIIGGQDDQIFKFPNSDYLNKSYEQIVKAKSTYDNLTFFHISGSNGMLYFGIRDTDIYVFDISKNVTYNLSDLINNYWDNLFIEIR